MSNKLQAPAWSPICLTQEAFSRRTRRLSDSVNSNIVSPQQSFPAVGSLYAWSTGGQEQNEMEFQETMQFLFELDNFWEADRLPLHQLISGSVQIRQFLIIHMSSGELDVAFLY